MDKLFAVLADTQAFPDDELPPNMFDYDIERRYSPICIDRERSESLNYGTRTHTVIIVDKQGHAIFAEMDRYRLNNNSFDRGEFKNVFEFDLDPDSLLDEKDVNIISMEVD